MVWTVKTLLFPVIVTEVPGEVCNLDSLYVPIPPVPLIFAFIEVSDSKPDPERTWPTTIVPDDTDPTVK